MKKLLIVIDMQNDFIDGTLGSLAAINIVDNVRKKIEKTRAEHHPIIFTRDTHLDNYLDTQEGKFLPVVHCIKGTVGHEISPKLPVLDAPIMDKLSFGSLKLAELIEENYSDMEEIELIGLCTDICVVSNALILKAKFPELRISVDPSCCAGVTVESHNAALTTMKMCQVIIQ